MPSTVAWALANMTVARPLPIRADTILFQERADCRSVQVQYGSLVFLFRNAVMESAGWVVLLVTESLLEHARLVWAHGAYPALVKRPTCYHDSYLHDGNYTLLCQ
ncbi:uncharacterized protein F5Z01DRAFT_430294 [Emericellopsis atlantica]|uniref:Uncharacterized protein n=1 Tax=Emericellopsis atlantica TaxID=2614577 RepID=A0A9P7ZDD9_9HYPO|nr:uncharacterized protein F5Z01DRAFT_430294 [Emericellopsis atlantica]KAG9250054.1 hypothetical protein F5Z01DRAFT_430294 [Emericellopsis atlantica]